MGFLHLPVRVPLRRNFRSVPSPFRGGFFVIACFDFIAYFLGGSKYVVITFRVATSTSLPPLKGEVAALADGEVLCGTKNFAYIMTERFQVVRKAYWLCRRQPYGLPPPPGEGTSPTELPFRPLPFQGRPFCYRLF